MKNAWQRWRLRRADRRRAARRAAGSVRWKYKPDARHSAFRKPRFGRFETLLSPSRWVWRAVWVASALGAGWFCWESWRAWSLFN